MKRAAVIAAAWVCSVGYADTLTLIDTAGERHDLKAWDVGCVPTQADDVVIPAGGDCTAPFTLAGTGQFVVSAGRLEVGRLDVAGKSPRLLLLGGAVTTETPLKVRFR